jgi:hypothetical protein
MPLQAAITDAVAARSPSQAMRTRPILDHFVTIRICANPAISQISTRSNISQRTSNRIHNCCTLDNIWYNTARAISPYRRSLKIDFPVRLAKAFIGLVPDRLSRGGSLTPMAAISCHNVAQFFIFLAKMGE